MVVVVVVVVEVVEVVGEVVVIELNYHVRCIHGKEDVSPIAVNGNVINSETLIQSSIAMAMPI